MKYNANYDRWVSKDGLVYRYSKTKDKLVLCKASLLRCGYLTISIGKGKTYSDFGKKFKEHFGITRLDNLKLYQTEKSWYYNHNNKCRWEV